jgi:hypothetical protein
VIYGITGHQEREGIDWDWVRARIHDELAKGGTPLRGLSSLARGADQVFAQELVALDGKLTVIVPKEGYETLFHGDSLLEYRKLLNVATVEHMPTAADDEAAFLAAGLRVANECEVLIAVWDGEIAQGSGGTADIVEHAKAIGRDVVHLQPIKREIYRF